MTYRVKLDFFEGPLDLLLFLIKKERIDIQDISIARITEQYLAYLEVMKLLDLEIAGEFLIMAATLMHIKSRSLLPPDENPDEEQDEEDPREELIRRLLEYKQYKEAASQLGEMKDKQQHVVMRSTSNPVQTVEIGSEEYYETSLFDLISAFRKVLSRVEKEVFHEVVKDRFTVSDKIAAIADIIKEKGKIRFFSLFDNVTGKDEVIATFLAVLEMMKMREIVIAQKGFFGDIEIFKNMGEGAGEITG